MEGFMVKPTRKRVVLCLGCLGFLLLSVVLTFGFSSGAHTVHADTSYSHGDPNVTNGVLNGVTTLPDGEVYATGWEGAWPGEGLIEHFIGGSWQKVDLPASTGSLYGISADLPTDIWVVGADGDFPVVLHSDGSSWTRVDLPNEFGCYWGGHLFGVVAFSPLNVWAVGYGCDKTPLTMHWDGTAWSIYYSFSAQGDLNSLAGTADNLWAVGYDGDGPIAQHWDGNSWVPLPATSLPNYDGFAGVGVLSDGTIWAVSAYGSLAHFDPQANTWSILDTSSHPDVQLDGLTQKGDDLYAVGVETSQGANGAVYTPMGYHYDGATWNFFTLPQDSNPMDFPQRASIAQDGSVFIVGGSYASMGDFPTIGLPIIWQYVNTPPTPTPSPTPKPTRGKLFVYIQGVNTAYSGSGIPQDFAAIDSKLKSKYSNATYVVFSYPGTSGNSSYQCGDTFTDSIGDDIFALSLQINLAVQAHPNSDIYIIAHSLGGVIAFGYMAALVEKEGFIQPLPVDQNGKPLAVLKDVDTLDSPIAGVTGSPDYAGLIGLVAATCYTNGSFPTLTAIDQLKALFKTATDSKHRGQTASIVQAILGNGIVHYPYKSNQSVADDAKGKGITTFTEGNTNDPLWIPHSVCPAIEPLAHNFPSTQWLLDEGSAVYGRVFTSQPASCSASSITQTHKAVLELAATVKAIVQVINKNVPSALKVAP
jgi:hypothetical protein